MLKSAESILDRIEQALVRIEDGTYGWSEYCGKPIESERLQAVPYVTLCLDCKQGLEAQPDQGRRPVEEGVVWPPFGRAFRDGFGEPGVDGEDT